MMAQRLTLAIGVLAVVAGCHAQEKGRDLIGADASTATANIKYEASSLESATPEASGVSLVFRLDRAASRVTKEFPTYLNFTDGDGIYMRFRNLENKDVSFTFRFEATPEIGRSGFIGHQFNLRPNAVRDIVFWFDKTAPPLGLSFFPPKTQFPYIGYKVSVEGPKLNEIRRWMIYNQTPGSMRLAMDEIRLVQKETNFVGMLDRYGQRARFNFPGKITNDAQFATNYTNEHNWLNSTPDATELMGSTTLPLSSATNRWRVERTAAGNAYFITPTGRKFWSVGINAVNADMPNRVGGRETLFEWLPSTDEPLGAYYQTRPTQTDGNQLVYNLHKANLHRKFGQDWRAPWLDQTEKRLKKWGINTLGGFSEVELTQRTTPYVKILWTNQYPKRMNTPNVSWYPLPDPFTPDFVTWMRDRFKLDLAKDNGRSNFMGVFVDNENSWGPRTTVPGRINVAVGALNCPPTQPAKQQFIRTLRQKYVDIAKLNTAWGTNHTSWDKMYTATVGNPQTFTPGMYEDCRAFVRAFADRYYSSVRNALSAAGFTGLYLGARDNIDITPDDVWTSQVKYVDALSINVYGDNPENWAAIEGLTKPFIISEFSYSSTDRGHYTPNLWFAVNDQNERVSRAKAYIDRMLSLKNCLGVHWFDYIDEPFNGRFTDDEKMNCGFIDITDNPYMGLVNMFRDFSQTMYSRRN